MGAQALVCLWTLEMLALVTLRDAWQRPLTMEEARREIPRRHRRGVLARLQEPFLSSVHLMLCDLFAA
jgi:hypothetical protein